MGEGTVLMASDGLLSLFKVFFSTCAMASGGLFKREQFKLRLENSERHWEMETALRREEIAAAFNQSFLGVLGQLVEAMRDRRV
ncbi:unnamed protein product [Boreogadus saida]